MRLTPDRLRLLASLAFNLLAKVPGVAAVFVILPLVSRSLGTAAYGELLSALALGAAFTLPFGGINAVGRRLLAAAYGARDQPRQADVFATTLLFMAGAALPAAAIMVTASAAAWSRPVFIAVSLLPLLAGFLNTFDNLRASYNEHYVSALLQIVFQTAIYAGVYRLGLPRGGIAAAALTLQAPFILASLATGLVLLIGRPFLRAGRIVGLRGMAFPAVGVMLADGALLTVLNLSVWWLQYRGNAAMAAWVGTVVRLFQSLLAPVLLVLFPLSSYLSMRWAHLTAQRRRALHRLFIVTGLVYGVAVGAAMAAAGPLYIDRMFGLAVRGDRIDVLAISLFMGTVIAQKAYALLLYAVSEARFLSYGTALVALCGIGVALGLGPVVSAMGAIDALFVTMGVGLLILLLVSDHRGRRAGREAG
jgi:O-antigen/teichoic acid export membrane protein